jgi:hypothetical protein
MRLNEISPAQRRLLSELASGISDSLEAHFVELPAVKDASIGVALREGTCNVVVEVPLAILVQATTDASGREILRYRAAVQPGTAAWRLPRWPSIVSHRRRVTRN